MGESNAEGQARAHSRRAGRAGAWPRPSAQTSTSTRSSPRCSRRCARSSTSRAAPCSSSTSAGCTSPRRIRRSPRRWPRSGCVSARASPGASSPRRPVWSGDITADERVSDVVRGTGSNLDTRSYLAVPLVCLGETIGALQIDSKEVDAFDDDDVTLLEGLAAQVAGVIESARRYAGDGARAIEERLHLACRTSCAHRSRSSTAS